MFLQAWICEDLHDGSDGAISLGDHETEAECDVRAELSACQTLHKVMDKHLNNEKLMADFITSLITFLRSLPEDLDQNCVAEHMQRLETEVMPNITLRGQIVDFVAELVACPNPPDTFNDALDEWRTRANQVDATSFLSAALTLNKHLHDMKEMALKLECTEW